MATTAQISQPSPTLPLPSPAATLRVPAGPGIAWTATGQEFDEHTQATGLARLDDGPYILLGANLRIGAGSSMAATSPDGLTWTLLGPGLEPVDGLTLTAAATRPGVGTVVVGTLYTPGRAAPNGDPTVSATGVVYRQRPGSPWERVAVQPSLQLAELSGVIATPDRFIAFGARASGPAGCTSNVCPPGASIWTSSDGVTWVAALLDAQPDPKPVTIDGIVADARGLLAYSQSSTPRANALWASPDGRRWTAIRSLGLNGVTLGSIIATTSGYLGVAGFPEGPTVFRSPDGVQWTPIAATGPSLERVIAVDGGFVAWNNTLGDVSGFVTAGYGVWTSPDGAVWTKVDRYGEFYSGQMIASGRTLVSFGSASDPNPVWIGIVTIAPPAS